MGLRHVPDRGEVAEQTARAFALGLRSIPTQHLARSFEGAIAAHRTTYDLAAPEVLVAYESMMPELQQQAREHALEQEGLLRAGHGSLGRMALVEWKGRHNLPAEWSLGNAYPPESDLCGQEVPGAGDVAWCGRCGDGGWLVDRTERLAPKLVACPDCLAARAAG